MQDRGRERAQETTAGLPDMPGQTMRATRHDARRGARSCRKGGQEGRTRPPTQHPLHGSRCKPGPAGAVAARSGSGFSLCPPLGSPGRLCAVHLATAPRVLPGPSWPPAVLRPAGAGCVAGRLLAAPGSGVALGSVVIGLRRPVRLRAADPLLDNAAAVGGGCGHRARRVKRHWAGFDRCDPEVWERKTFPQAQRGVRRALAPARRFGRGVPANAR